MKKFAGLGGCDGCSRARLGRWQLPSRFYYFPFKALNEASCMSRQKHEQLARDVAHSRYDDKGEADMVRLSNLS